MVQEKTVATALEELEDFQNVNPSPEGVPMSALHELRMEIEQKALSICNLEYLQNMRYVDRQKIQHIIPETVLEEAAQWVEFENLISEEITPEHIHDLSEFIRYIFSNDWPEFAFCPNCDPVKEHGKRLSIKDIFGTEKREYISLDEIDDPSTLPCCDECGAKMQHFLDKYATPKTLAKKFKEKSWLTLMRDIKGNIVGANFAYKSSIKKVFDNEWENIYSYADEHKRPNDKRDFGNFLDKVSNAISTNDSSYGLAPGEKLGPEEDFICANLIAVDPGFQGSGHFFNLVGNSFMMTDPKEFVGVYGAGESLPRTRAHKLFLRGGGIEVPGILMNDDVELTPDDYVTIIYRIDRLFEAFCS